MEPLGRLKRRALRLAVPALAFGAIALCPALEAAPLDKNACARLSQDLQDLKSLDVDKLMEKGPNWAAANLSASDLGLVRDYIDLDEQIKFRCQPPGALVRLKQLEEEDEDAAGKPAAQAGPEKGAKAKGESPAPKPAKPPQAQKRERPVQAGSMLGR
jgi:hypothetical protein